MNKKLIDNISWWIPIRKWRDNFRNYINNRFNKHIVKRIVLIQDKIVI